MAISAMRPVWTVAELQEGLTGSPYSVPDDPEATVHVTEMLYKIVDVADAADGAQRLLRKTQARLLGENQRVKELHESNRVEGLGPVQLAQTRKILRSDAARKIARATHLFTVVKSLEEDARTMDVLGLHGAKIFAEQLVKRYPHEPIAEIDLRGMHDLVMGSDPFAGRYKQYVNAISGSEHQPLAPSDTPDAMYTMVTWLNTVVAERSLPPVVTAAAVHAWLAHIHPFHDGNGRIARLLANLVVGAHGLPPLIIRDAADRDRYIDALAISDAGGDLAPLIGVFLRVMGREIADMRDPEFAFKLFEDEVQQRSLGEYAQWRRTILAWLADLGGALRLRGLYLRFREDHLIDQATFRRIKAGQSDEGVVFGGIGNEHRYPDCRAYLMLRRTQHLFRFSDGEPALSLLRYGPQPWSQHVYRPMDSTVRELILKADPDEGVYLRFRDDRADRLSGTRAAVLVADAIAEDFAAGHARAIYAPTTAPPPDEPMDDPSGGPEAADRIAVEQ